MAKLVGGVDELGRPIVRVDVPGHDGFLAVVDTGFNGSLMLQRSEATTQGFLGNKRLAVVELGTTAQVVVEKATGSISWLGRELRVEALISNQPAPIQRPDTARALLGTELLADCLLLVDFATRVVEIETQA